MCNCLTMLFSMYDSRAVTLVSSSVHFQLHFAARSTSIASKPYMCTWQTDHSQHSKWHRLPRRNLHRTLHFPMLMEFQCIHGILGCHGEKVVTSELKLCHFFTIPLTDCQSLTILNTVLYKRKGAHHRCFQEFLRLSGKFLKLKKTIRRRPWSGDSGRSIIANYQVLVPVNGVFVLQEPSKYYR